jgi:hypothetical protein
MPKIKNVNVAQKETNSRNNASYALRIKNLVRGPDNVIAKRTHLKQRQELALLVLAKLYTAKELAIAFLTIIKLRMENVKNVLKKQITPVVKILCTTLIGQGS